MIKNLIAWCWQKLTGEDPVVVRNHLKEFERLNEVHCDFIQKLNDDHPELRPKIAAHQRDRFNAVNR